MMNPPMMPSTTPRAFRQVQCRHQLPLTLTRVTARGPWTPWPAGPARPSRLRPAAPPARLPPGRLGLVREPGTGTPRGPVRLAGVLGAGRPRVAAAAAISPRGAVADVGGLVIVEVTGRRAAETLGVPAVGVVTQVVVDRPAEDPVIVAGVAPVRRVAVLGPVNSLAPGTAVPPVAIPNVKVISFAAHASSLVARRPRLAGKRPLPDGGSGHPGTRRTHTLPPASGVHWLVRARRLRRTAGSPVPRT